ncbi:putative motility protein [Virgibacillus halodenitrificans]|uniref:YjfB family protein n=1 Tax=Virgibacillus halodenitrificans TaxID=1482 RepID=UPI0013718854|nr:YjfB family protein [Virgibacillus halodenitrificans]MYL47702.1 putative motility protein [Virgibacillus halodenitrificans]
MDVALMSMALSQGKVQQQASLSVMRMAMGDAKQEGAAMRELLSTTDASIIQRVAQPHIGGNVDIKG